MVDFLHPQKIQPGDRIAILSPSWGGPHTFPGIFDTGLEVLRSQLDLEPVEFPTARMAPEELRRAPRRRAADINAAFADPSIKGIIASIGGDDSVRILPYLDLEIIRRNPKLVMGFSDTTTLLAYLAGQGLVTFHGPAVMAGIAQFEALGAAYQTHLRELLFGNQQITEYRSYPKYSEGYPDWGDPEQLGQIKGAQPNPGWNWLQKADDKRGSFWGGCIEVLEFMKGTDFWPERSFFDDKFLLFETSEDRPTPQQVGWMLRNYGMQTILERIQGLVFGRPLGYTQEQKAELRTIVQQIVVDEFGRSDIPLVLNFDVGHTDPQLIIPFGVQAEMSSEREEIRLVEPVFAA